jgi:hypothetical protein
MRHPPESNWNRRPEGTEGTSKMASEQPCPYCGGAGEVRGVVDDVEFIFKCSCSGGSEESVRWLLGLNDLPPPGQDWII